MTRRKTGISCFVSKAITESCVRDEWSEDTHDEGKNCYRTHQHIYNKKRRREKGEEEKFCEKKLSRLAYAYGFAECAPCAIRFSFSGAF
jgi:catabolite regulation protein CreA